MLEIQRFRTRREEIVEGLKKRNYKNAEELVAQVEEFDTKRRAVLSKVEGLRSEQKGISDSIQRLRKEGKKEDGDAAVAKSGEIKAEIKNLEDSLKSLEIEQEKAAIPLPNVPHSSVPPGKSAEDNVVAFRNHIIPTLPPVSKPHWELAKDLDIIDWELGSKITGSGFPVYKGKGARLLRGLIQYFLDEGDKAGYIEICPPLMVNEDSGYGTGQLPDKEGQMYHVQIDNLYLIPTAEVPITNLYRDVILDEKQLPVRNCGYTPCFRREAGSYGSDVKGLNRLHQFDKVEIVEIAHPDTSYERLEVMVAHVKALLDNLGLPYRQLLLCGGDMGFTSAKTYDLEVWSGGQERWLEVSSVSCFETFQANRLKLRFKDASGKNRLCHTLNGSALALPRVMAALMENNQREDGSIAIPAVLHRYCGFDVISKG